MTHEEAKEYHGRLSTEQQVEVLREHYRLKQELCANVLIVATGATDWVDRAIRAATKLREHKHQLRKIIQAETALLEEAAHRIAINDRDCNNCQGSGIVHGKSCVCCNGAGTHRFG